MYKNRQQTSTDISSLSTLSSTVGLTLSIIFLSDMLAKISLVVLSIYVVCVMSSEELSLEDQWSQFKVSALH